MEFPRESGSWMFLECTLLSFYDVTGLTNGGVCSCGDTFGKHGAQWEAMCNVTCVNGWAEQNCGGEQTNAVYRVVRGDDVTLIPQHFM